MCCAPRRFIPSCERCDRLANTGQHQHSDGSCPPGTLQGIMPARGTNVSNHCALQKRKSMTDSVDFVPRRGFCTNERCLVPADSGDHSSDHDQRCFASSHIPRPISALLCTNRSRVKVVICLDPAAFLRCRRVDDTADRRPRSLLQRTSEHPPLALAIRGGIRCRHLETAKRTTAR